MDKDRELCDSIMTAAIYQCGDTIQVTESFYSFTGQLENLSAAPTVTLYAADKTTVIRTGTATNTPTGTYQYQLTLPSVEGIYYLAFTGTATDTSTVAHRELIYVKFSAST